MPFLKTFDCAAVTECYERKESIIPQQALAMMNSELTLSSGRALARRLGEQCDADDEPGFVTAAFETILSREPTDPEIEACLDFLDQQQTSFAAGDPQVTEAASGADDLAKPAAEPHVRARENLVQVLLNHHDFVTIR